MSYTSQSITNSYNASGQRIKKVENGATTKYFYSGSVNLFTTNENNVLLTENILDLSGSIIASLRFEDENPNTPDPYAGKYFFFNYDVRGSTTAILQPDGAMVKGYEYDVFGALTQSGASDFLNEVTFTGSVSDLSSGLQYMNARFYNPSTGRFLSQDSYSGNAYDPWTQHLYSYSGNNPVNMIDPTGHRAMFIDEVSMPEPKPEQQSDQGSYSSDLALMVKGGVSIFVGIASLTVVVLSGGSAVPLVAVGLAATGTAGSVCLMTGAYDTVEAFSGSNPLRSYLGSRNYDDLQGMSLLAASQGTLWIDQVSGFTNAGSSSSAINSSGSDIIWDSWESYNKVTKLVNGEEKVYAQIGDRLYTQHAVDRMMPCGMTTYGRSVSPNYVESVLNTGELVESKIVNGVLREIWQSGTVQVITEDAKNTIVSIITK